MAGEELERDNPVAEAARESVADAGENKSLADRYGQDYVDRVKGDGSSRCNWWWWLQP